MCLRSTASQCACRPSLHPARSAGTSQEGRPMDDDAHQRFESLVDRSGEHHLWIGATNPSRGAGRVKVKGRQMTAHRLAWGLAYGPLPFSAKVLACRTEPACVRIDHLRCEGAPVPVPLLDGATAQSPAGRGRGRARKGTGSMRQLAPDVWKLSVTTVSTDAGGRGEFIERSEPATRRRLARSWRPSSPRCGRLLW